MAASGGLDFRKSALTAVLVGLAFLGTMFVRIPIPATTGYFNVGDMFVVLAGLWLGPWRGLLVGLLGPTAADLIGFPQFVLATAVTKGLEGFVVGLIAKSREVQDVKIGTVAGLCGGAVMITGYFLFEAFVYPWLANYVSFFGVTNLGAAIIELGPNLVQGIIGAIGGVALWRTINGSTRKVE